MKRLFTFIKQLFTKKCDEPLHNHHDGCPECDMPDDSYEYPDNHWTNTDCTESDIEKYYEDNVTILDCGSIVNKHEYKERGY
tara:strand:+ start:301 stop:546 length:246 start_codon:yes stop_codon:yes gene_type:complete